MEYESLLLASVNCPILGFSNGRYQAPRGGIANLKWGIVTKAGGEWPLHQTEFSWLIEIKIFFHLIAIDKAI